jgi:hypothetical protein
MTEQKGAQCWQSADALDVSQKMKTLEEAAAQISADMHLPEGFLLALKTGDDWCFS